MLVKPTKHLFLLVTRKDIEQIDNSDCEKKIRVKVDCDLNFQ